MAKQLRLDVAQLTDVGRKREHNEDNMAYHIPPEVEVMTQKGALFIVADGMGGHAAGEVASEIAVDTISEAYYHDDDDDVTASLVHAIKRANASIHQRAAENMLRSGMGTTCVSAVLRGDMAYIANVGDSRAYLVRNGDVKQVSQDHSWVAEQVRAGLLSDDQARTHAQRNVITRCLGTQADVEVDIFAERLLVNDSLVLCTDGLSGLVSDEDLRSIVSQFVPQESVYHLVERANENGGPDNITAIVVRVQDVGVEPTNGRQAAFIGGRETGEDTRVSSGLVTVPLKLSPRPFERSSGPLPSSSGPLIPAPMATADPAYSDTLPQPVVKAPRRRAGRLMYTSMALIILLLIGIVGGAAYYVLGVLPFPPIRGLITKANGEVTTNPTLALQDLASAQKLLQGVPDTPLSHTQRIQLTGQLTTTVKAAVDSYNTHGSITPLCPVIASTAPVSNGSTGTQAERLAVLHPGSGPALHYTLGHDHKLYQLNSQNSLANPLNVSSSVQVLDAVGDNARLAVLVKGNAANNYFLDVVVSDKLDQLHVTDSNYLIPVNGQVPTLLAAQGNDIYVVLAAPAAATTQARVLDFTVGSNNTLTADPVQTSFTAPGQIVSVAAFPNHLLFFLLANGSVMSLQGGALGAVLVSAPPPTPLAVSNSAEVTDSTPVPTVPLAVPSTGPVPLQIPSSAHLSAGSLAAEMVGNTWHLYLADAAHVRVLDLSGEAQTGGQVPPGTAGSGGKQPLFQMVQQYTSSNMLAQVKGITVDSTGMLLYALMQTNSSTTSLLSIKLDASASSTCA